MLDDKIANEQNNTLDAILCDIISRRFKFNAFEPTGNDESDYHILTVSHIRPALLEAINSGAKTREPHLSTTKKNNIIAILASKYMGIMDINSAYISQDTQVDVHINGIKAALMAAYTEGAQFRTKLSPK